MNNEVNKIYERPWGTYQTVALNDNYQIKIIEVQPGAKLSLQLHEHRAEHWTVVQGQAWVTLDEDEFPLGVNERTFIPKGARHRMENKGQDTLRVIEIQVGSYLGEDDIVRFDDVYGRVEA